MVEPGEVLSAHDIETIAGLHLTSMDETLPSLLGLRYVKDFYRFLAVTESEWLFVERVEGEVESVCVLSLDPNTLYGRIFRSTFLTLSRSALSAILVNPAFRTFLRRYLADLLRGQDRSTHAPEITYIFTSQAQRGRHLGARLVHRVDVFLQERGVAEYYVKTEGDSTNRALAFYDRNGFCRIGKHTERGQIFVQFRKRLGRH